MYIQLYGKIAKYMKLLGNIEDSSLISYIFDPAFIMSKRRKPNDSSYLPPRGSPPSPRGLRGFRPNAGPQNRKFISFLKEKAEISIY